uniref:Uncharacterized protein n=1 Tax=Anguilla anguilla TaxID=7936 RepID=A0A0E9TQH4_ANGAN
MKCALCVYLVFPKSVCETQCRVRIPSPPSPCRFNINPVDVN